MFNPEQSIAEWRRQMLSAGIKTPVPLEELEIHLREDIEQQMKSGLSEQDAFNSTVKKIGEAGLLKTEFKKADCSGSLIKSHRVLAMLWMTLCGAPILYFLGFLLHVRNSHPVVIYTLDFDLAVLFCLLALAGAVAGFPLFRGAQWARKLFVPIAVLSVMATIAWIIAVGSLSMFIAAFDFLSLASVVLLQMEHTAKEFERNHRTLRDNLLG
jgi:hypothetical protein